MFLKVILISICFKISYDKKFKIFEKFKSLNLSFTDFFSTNKQYLKIKLMQNETNRWSFFFGKNEIFVKLF